MPKVELEDGNSIFYIYKDGSDDAKQAEVNDLGFFVFNTPTMLPFEISVPKPLGIEASSLFNGLSNFVDIFGETALFNFVVGSLLEGIVVFENEDTSASTFQSGISPADFLMQYSIPENIQI